MVSVAVSIENLNSWDSLSAYNEEQNIYDTSMSKPDGGVTFEVNKEINSKVFLWNGNVAHLVVGCIVIPFNDALCNGSTSSEKFCSEAGSRFRKQIDDIAEMGEMTIGTVGTIEECGLQCKNVIYVSEPRVCGKYKSSFEMALHNCYRASLQLAADKGYQSVAITKLYNTANSELSSDMAHVAIRTLRCCLQNLSSNFDAIVVVVEEQDMEMYDNLLSTYFPRYLVEGYTHSASIATGTLGSWGEILHPDRNIRITDLSIARASPKSEDDLSETSSSSSDAVVPGTIGNHSFTKMSGDHDEKRKSQLRKVTREETLKTRERIYSRMLRLARTTDLSRIAATNSLYLCGQDHGGSPVVVLVAKYMDVPNIDLDQVRLNHHGLYVVAALDNDSAVRQRRLTLNRTTWKALLYFIHVLDSVVKRRYSIVYFHTMSQQNNRIPSEFLRKAYNTLDQRYKSNLKYLYIVHPTFWSKVFTMMFTAFNASGIKNQIMFIRSIPQIYQFISADQIDIPRFVVNHDLQANSGYYRTVKRSKSLPPRRTSNFNEISTENNM